MSIRIVGKGPVAVGGAYAVEVDGKPLPYVKRVELVIEAGSVVQGVIHIIPDAIDITGIDSNYVQMVSAYPSREESP